MSTFWRDRPVLVTGATGLVGARVVRRLRAEGATVVCLIRDWVPESELFAADRRADERVVRGELCDAPLLERILAEYEIDTVIHLAAQTIVPIANRNPVSTFESNVRGTWLLLEACRRSPRVRQVVAASSDKAYGEHVTLPYVEDTPLQGRYPYDVSKSCADLIAQSYAASFDLPVTIARCGNFYGGGDLNWNRLVPGTIRSLLRGEAPTIRSDGTLVRDYLHVDDGAAAYLMLAEALAGNRALAGQAFNFSTEQPLSVLEMVAHLTRLVGVDVRPVVLAEPSREIQRQTLNATKARRVLGWKPAVALDDGLTEAIGWYRRLLAAS